MPPEPLRGRTNLGPQPARLRQRSRSFAALLVLAGIVLVPLLATALSGFKDLGELQRQSVRPAACLGVAATTGTF